MVNYDNVGKISKNYIHEPREVKPYGLFTSRDLVLKLYDMHKIGTISKISSEEVKHFLGWELIGPSFSGLGFAILSEDMLNVAIWDDHVIKNQIYLFETGKLRDAKPVDIGKEGPFCIWELGIVQYEKRTWKRFLESERTEEDKKRYIEDKLEGNL